MDLRNMSLFEYPNGEKSKTPIDPLDQNNVYEYIAENGPLAGPMLQAYVDGMEALSSLVTSLSFHEKDPVAYQLKLSELLDQKALFCEFVTDKILLSTLPTTEKVINNLRANTVR